MRRGAGLAAVALALLLPANGSGASDPPSHSGRAEPEPGTGVLCVWSLVSVAVEVGKHCPGKGDPTFEAALNESLAMIDRYVAANGPATPDQIDMFKRRQGGVGWSTERLCTADTLPVYDQLRAQGAEKLRLETARLLARPGIPAWGDCA